MTIKFHRKLTWHPKMHQCFGDNVANIDQICGQMHTNPKLSADPLPFTPPGSRLGSVPKKPLN